MKNVNKEYWDRFYSNDNSIPYKSSDFCRFVIDRLSSDKKILDVACGNGRDSLEFLRCGFDVTSIDLSSNLKEFHPNLKFRKADMLKFDYFNFDVIYLRFVLHTINEKDLDKLIDRIKETSNNCKIFIETRSTKGISDEEKTETNFKSSIGDKHFRMLYSKEYLIEKFKSHFNIIHVEEDINFARFLEENPYCIRMILDKDD